MQRIFITFCLFCTLIFSPAAWACTFLNAVYVPDPGDSRSKADHFKYKITVAPQSVLVLNTIDPQTQEPITKLKMQYRINTKTEPASVLWISKKENIELQLFDKNFIEIRPHNETDEAPRYIILHESYAKFLDLPEEDLDIEYLSRERVKPGGLVGDQLELIPDTWVLEECAKSHL